MSITTIDDGSISIIVSQDGTQGPPGEDGLDGVGLNAVRKSIIENPLCAIFSPNFLARRGVGVVSWVRETVATYVDRYGQFRVALGDTGEEQPRQGSDGWIIEEGSTNLLLFSENPATQDVTITGGTYTLSIGGSGSADTIYGSATEGNPLTFVSSGEVLAVSVTGSPDRFWLEPLPYQTSYIESRDVALSRDPDDVEIYSQNNFVTSQAGFSITADITLYGVAGGDLMRVDTSPVDGFSLTVNQDRTITATLKDELGQDYQATTVSTFDAGTTKSFACVFDGEVLTVFVSGVSESSTQIVEPVCATVFSGLTKFGGAGVNLSVSDLRIYDLALNSVEVDYLSRS